jgi:acetyl-CoA C-acetyltransferase
MSDATKGSAFVVAALRTPVGRRGGALSHVHPVDLMASTLATAVEQIDIDPELIDDVIVGCVDQVGAQALNIGRTAVLAAGLPESVPATTVDRQCGSSQQAIHFAAQGIMASSYDLVIAGGVEVMSLVPMAGGATAGRAAGMGEPHTASGWRERYGELEPSQFIGADLIAQRWRISRDEMESFAARSHTRANEAWEAGRFATELAPVEGIARDETVRDAEALTRMPTLAPVDGTERITPALASPISDGAAALVLASERMVSRSHLEPLARIAGMTVAASDPKLMLTAPIPATRKLFERAGVTPDAIDRFEVNEAFASVPLAWQRELRVDPERVNVNGGALALGHPLGATGARIMTSLVHEMRRARVRLGIQTMCEAGGMANATLLEAA